MKKCTLDPLLINFNLRTQLMSLSLSSFSYRERRSHYAFGIHYRINNFTLKPFFNALTVEFYVHFNFLFFVIFHFLFVVFQLIFILRLYIGLRDLTACAPIATFVCKFALILVTRYKKKPKQNNERRFVIVIFFCALFTPA